MGINTSTPQYTLDVNGTMRVQGTSELYNDVKIYNTAGTLNAANGYIRMTTQDGNSYIQSGSNSTNTSNKLYFTSIGETTSKVTVDMVNSRMGININSPAETLDVNGSVWARSTLYVGSDSSTNQIRFYGTVGDGEGTFSHTVIAEYLYGGVEQSELILFKGNNSATTSGPDRVRVLASGGFQVDSGFGLDWQQDSAPPTATYQNALFVSGANGNVGINTNLPRQTLDVNGVLNLQAGTVQGYTFVDSANKTNTYAVFAEAGSGSDWAFLRNIGTLDNYHMALDLHDDDSVNFSIRKVRSSAITDTIQTMFTIDGANSRAGIMTSTPQYTLDVEGDLRVTGSSIGSAASVFTAGMIMIWATATAPTGWFVCNGDAVSRTTYSVLFAIIGSTYGNGDGVNTFNLPDLRSRFPLGTSGTYGLGTTGGSMTQTLTSNQMPAHSHGITDLGHAHESKFPASQGVSSGTSDNAADELLGRAYDTPTTSTLTGITINSAGGGQAFNIINSYQAVNYIIKY
jgi:microcystin-dependent protein